MKTVIHNGRIVTAVDDDHTGLLIEGGVAVMIAKTINVDAGSPELSNMFVKLVEYYGKYQNTYIKHDAAVIEDEIEFVIEITSTFMKHLVRIAGRAV